MGTPSDTFARFAAHRRTLAIGALHSAGITDLGSGDPMTWVAQAA